MTNKIMQVLQGIDVGEGCEVLEWKTLNRGDTQYQRYSTAKDSGAPIRMLHPFNKNKGGRPYKVIINQDAMPKGMELAGIEI